LTILAAITGYRREDAKEKKMTTDTYWVPGVNCRGKRHARLAMKRRRGMAISG